MKCVQRSPSRDAMARESERAPAGLSDRMEAVMRESHGLQYVIADGDMDVYPRYRHLLGEFCQFLQDKEKAATNEIRRREAAWE